MPWRLSPACLFAALSLGALLSPARAQTPPTTDKSQAAPAKSSSPAKSLSPDELLQQAINSAGNDRFALVRNLEAYLKDYPEARQRPQIYRALVEASLQLRDNARAANYAERLISLSPDDISMTILTIQLLERDGDEAALRRAVSYSTHVLDFVQRGAVEEKSRKISTEEWLLEKKRDRSSILSLRGRLEMKLKDTATAQTDFESSYSVLPSSTAAEMLGEIAELQKNLNGAIKQYAIAFALADATSGNASRRELRQKLGNVWRLARGSDAGLGEYLLLTYDEVSKSSLPLQSRKNSEALAVSDFVLRTAPDGAPYPLRYSKGKILVINFWATWCGPCHALEPLFARVSMNFQPSSDVLFLAADCDEDESLVKPYLEGKKSSVPAVFADGLDRFFSVNAFPTVMVIDRDGKVAYRSNGFDPDSFESELTAAVRRAITPLSASAPTSNPTP